MSTPEEASARNVEILARVSRALLQTIDLDQQLGLALNLAVEALKADRGSIMLVEGDELVVRCAEGPRAPAAGSRQKREVGIAGWVAQNNEPVVLHGDVSDQRFQGRDASISSSISLPLAARDKVLGVMNLLRLSDLRFDEPDLQLATSLGDLAALAIEKAKLYSDLREREARVSALLAEAIGAQERERRRMAAEIHDGFLQDLSAVFLKAELLKVLMSQGQHEQAAQVSKDIQEAIRDEVKAVRDFIFEVRPPSLDEVGVGPTIRAMAEKISDENGLKLTFKDDSYGERMSDAIETVLYRVAQEAVRNVVKHAKAKNVSVCLRLDGDEALLDVLDDGVGIKSDGSKPGHFGLLTMRERVELAGGTFSVGPRAKGTAVRVRLPKS